MLAHGNIMYILAYSYKNKDKNIYLNQSKNLDRKWLSLFFVDILSKYYDNDDVLHLNLKLLL